VSSGGAAVWRQRVERDPMAGSRQRREGDIRPKLQGGDRHSQRIEAHAELI
jgi:hypothetical protein